MKLTDRELATVIAALRYWQKWVPVDETPIELAEIASGDGKFECMDEAEIDALCERLNRYEPPFLVVTVEGGMIGSVCTDRPDDIAVAGVVIVDYDTDDAESEDIIEVPQDGGDTAEAVGYITDIETWPVTPAVAAAMRAKDRANEFDALARADGWTPETSDYSAEGYCQANHLTPPVSGL